MYPAGETYANLASVAFLNSLQDAAMLQPSNIGNGLLFPKGAVVISLGGDASMVSSTRQVILPLPYTAITIGRPYGKEIGYVTNDPANIDARDTDVEIWIPFSVWDNDGADQDEMEKRLLFSRDHRQNVYSFYGLNMQVCGQMGAKPRPTSPITGLNVTDYRWQFWFSRH